MLEEMIKSKDRQTKGALDALVAAYLTLKGPDGMPLVEDLFLKNKDAEYTDTYATIMALRFHGTEEKIIPRERLLAGIRLMLDRPQLADLVIPDLARWEDWSVMDRLVELFKNAERRVELGPRAGDQLPAGLPVARGQEADRRAGQARSRDGQAGQLVLPVPRLAARQPAATCRQKPEDGG